MILRTLQLFVLLLLLWDTFLFRYGLVGALCGKFYLIFIVWTVSFFLTAGLRAWRVVSQPRGARDTRTQHMPHARAGRMVCHVS